MNPLVNQPGLQSMNRILFLRKLALLDDQASIGRNGWNGWREFFVARTADEKGNIISFYLKATDGEPLATYAPGQYVTVKLPNETIRCWSISEWTGLDTPPYYRVSTKKSTASSKWMHSIGITSTRLSLGKPTGTFRLDWAPLFPPRQIHFSSSWRGYPWTRLLCIRPSERFLFSKPHWRSVLHGPKGDNASASSR